MNNIKLNNLKITFEKEISDFSIQKENQKLFYQQILLAVIAYLLLHTAPLNLVLHDQKAERFRLER